MNLKNFEGSTSLYLACDHRNASIKLIKLLLDKGADPNIPNHELIAPLHLACKHGNLPLVHLLLKYGASINAQDVDEYTPLHFAVNDNQKIIVEYLLKYKADTSLCESNGLNPLMLAIIRKYDEIFHVLLPATDNLNQLGKESETAVSLAVVTSNFEVLQKLVENGAEIYSVGPVSPLYLDNLYEQNNIELFQYIWNRINHAEFFKTDFFAGLLPKLIRMERVAYLYIIIESLSFHPEFIRNEVFMNIFQYRQESPEIVYFERNKEKLITIFQSLFDKNEKVQIQELKKFILFVKHCPYRIHLLSIALQNVKINYEENLIFDSFMSHPDVGLIFLQRAPFFYDFSNIFDSFIIADKIEFVKYILQFFSPTEATLRQMLEKVKSDFDKNILEKFSGKVKSLSEISRDAVRMYIGKNVIEYDIDVYVKIVQKLNCSKNVEDILLLKKPVNSIIC